MKLFSIGAVIALLFFSFHVEGVEMKPDEVICTYSTIKKGHVQDVREWLKTLQSRHSETLESLKNEGVSLEAAFIKKEKEHYYLVYFMRADDVSKAMEVCQNSELPIDQFHKKCFEDYIENTEVLETVLHLENPERFVK